MEGFILKLSIIKILFFGHVVSLQGGSTNAMVIQLCGEIKQLLKEVSSLSQGAVLEVSERTKLRYSTLGAVS